MWEGKDKRAVQTEILALVDELLTNELNLSWGDLTVAQIAKEVLLQATQVAKD